MAITTLVSGVPGKLATAVARGLRQAPDIELVAVHNPSRAGEWEGVPYVDEAVEVDVIVEAAPTGPVMDNLARWRRTGAAVVVGTSGFTRERIDEVRRLWEGAEKACLIVPNFSIGAVLMMRFAELAAPHFATVEIVERHSERKPDAPSGTALQTAARVAAAGGRSQPKSEELVAGALGGDVEGVHVHSLRLAGLLSHQEVAFTNSGEQFSIVHQSTSYDSFAAGAVAAVRAVVDMQGVAVGLDDVLGLK
ncbi:MAG TPA: 4-hydroxy-tetrahydrodipicolinate reductase [Acidimicrobiia bacterium]|jgi:4-hydroxy-tetrahydrodipicolinate reductase